MANPTLKATIPQAAFVKSALWVSPDVVGGSGAWDAKTSTRYAPWGTLSSAALGSTGINGLSSPGATNCGIDLGLAQLHSATPFDVTGSELTILVCAAADAAGAGYFIQNRNGYSPSEGWRLGSDSGYVSGSIATLPSPSSSGGVVTNGDIALYALTYDGTNCKVWKNGTQVGTIASTGNLVYNTSGERRAALFNLYQSRAINSVAQKIFGAVIYNKALTQAELQAFGTSNAAIVAGSFHAAAFDFGSPDASAAGGTGTSTGSGSGGAATGGAVSAGSAAGGTGTSTGSGSGGAATGAGAGSFVTEAMENNTGSGLLASASVLWSWFKGSIGAAPTSTTHGTGTTNSSGILTMTGLPAGAGYALVWTPDGNGVYYHPGTVT